MKEIVPTSISISSAIYMTSIIQCICTEIFECVINLISIKNLSRISSNHIQELIAANDDIKNMFSHGII